MTEGDSGFSENIFIIICLLSFDREILSPLHTYVSGQYSRFKGTSARVSASSLS
jgi:hypothetical protein